MKWFCILALSFLFPWPAQALCIGTAFSGVGATQTFAGSAGEYNVFDSTEYMQTMNFSVTSTASLGSCRYYVVLTAGGSNNAAQRVMTLSGQPNLNYNVYTTGHTVLLPSGSYNGSGVISGSFSSNSFSTNNHSLSWTIAPAQVVHANAARYQDTGLTLGLYAELGVGVYTLNDTKTITFQARPMSSIDLALVDSGAGFNAGDNSQTVSFGNLASGAIMSYDTMIRSNDGYLITMQSANQQALKHTSWSDTVPYSVLFNGISRNLSSGNVVTVVSDSGVTTALGTRFPTQFTIGTLSGLEPPGTYNDIITLTVSAN